MLIDAIRPPAGEPSAALALDAAVARGAYTNLAIVHHTETEFVLDFAFLDPSQDRGEVVSRMLMNPRQAKRLAAALVEHLATWEARYGALPDDAAGAPAPEPG